MADVGSLAAADVARELGVPVVFTVAPDPHAIESLDRSGRLTREDFGRVDRAEHFWFRARLVQRSRRTRRTRCCSRGRGSTRACSASWGSASTRTPSGTRSCPKAWTSTPSTPRSPTPPRTGRAATPKPALAELRGLVEGLAPERRGLPLVVTVGRLHRVKGMAALVETWARGPLAARANLLVIGGDLDSPSSDGRATRSHRGDRAVARPIARGLLLPGRPNDVAARWLAAAQFGLPG